jgi:hypothetical protein
MTFPVYKIEIYDSTPTLIHTITEDAIRIHVKETVTSNIGIFSFVLPTVKGIPNPYYYNDIAVNNTAKVYLGYDTISASDLVTVGKIQQITAPLSTQTGYKRVFSGMNQGEVLKRRLKRKKRWTATDAAVIVTDLAEDLGLEGDGSKRDANTIDLDLTVESETYLDVLSKVSDFWADVTHQVKNDFYVDVEGDLVWKARPIRTAGVETLTVGDNILGYNILRDINSVRNKILVFGRCNQPYPASGDAAESLDNWATDETGPTQATDWVEEGTYSIKATTAADQSIYLGYTISPAISCQFKHDYKKMHLWVRVNAGTFDSDAYLHLQLKTAEADYYKKIIRGIEPRKLTEYELPIGPESDWYEYGSPNWENINELRVWFSNAPTSSNLYLWVDGVRLLKDYNATVEDATSQTNYGIRELEHYSDQLWSNDDCTKRGQSLLYQLKDPIVRLDVTTPGNTNIKIGDRLSMTIPAEGISAANYDVVSVDHYFDADAGFITQCSMVNTGNTRTLPATSIKEVTLQKFDNLRKLGQGVAVIR